MSQEEIKNLERFCQSIIDTPHPFEAQPHQRENGKMWCNDWKIIEILKFLFNGEKMYRSDPPPNRLKNNPLWDQEEIIKEAKALVERFQTAGEIVEFLRSERLQYGACT